MSRCPFTSRRHFLGGATTALAALGTQQAFAATTPSAAALSTPPQATEPFWGHHQGGIITPPQGQTYFAAFDLITDKATAVVKLLQSWTQAAALMTSGASSPASGEQDSLEALGLPGSRLTLTFGFGTGLFVQNGKDRFGLAAHRPPALIDLPRFNGDQLEPARTGGDLSVQACADDPQIVFHAIRHLARLAKGTARLRWTQTGFNAGFPGQETPRNLMGFKDGTQNPSVAYAHGVAHPFPTGLDQHVWVGKEGPSWMQGGSYLVVRRIRIALEHWDETDVEFQEQTVGRRKLSGAPLTGQHEFDPLDLQATDADGNYIIAENAHVRMATAAGNDGAQILRRAFSYNDGTNVTAERWPPWHQGLEYDAGLLFICYQRDPRTGFVKIFEPMSKMDALNQYTTHTGGGLFAVPKGAGQGEFIGQPLFEHA